MPASLNITVPPAGAALAPASGRAVVLLPATLGIRNYHSLMQLDRGSNGG